METTETEFSYPAARLCSKCSVLQFDDRLIEAEQFIRSERTAGEPITSPSSVTKLRLDYHHADVLPELEGLYRSAEAGCDFCRYLRKAIRRKDLKGEPKGKVHICLSLYWRTPYASQYGLNALVAELRIQIDQSEKENFFEDETYCDEEGYIWQTANDVLFKAESGYGNCQNWLQLEPAPRKKALCAENIEAIQSILDECSEICYHSKESRLTPTRLLDLNAPDRNDGICLVETQSLKSLDELKYAALSYCWGSEVDAAGQSTTTTDNLGSRLADIRSSILSQVMQDAVVVTRSLRIRYLWIDSLCIIQDDLRDWERESEMMGLIYTNAFVTIGALASSSCHHSFLDRPDSLPIKFRSARESSIHGTYNLRCYPRNGSYTLFDGKSLDQIDSVWETRAWTLQESKLSTRLLLFGASRLILRCANRESVEPFDEHLLDLTPEAIPSYTPNGQTIDPYQRRHMYDLWIVIILELFSGRHITNKDDIFPALSGIAKRVAMVTGDLYVAGFWKNDLPRGLDWLWRLPSQNSLEDRLAKFTIPQNCICPSWSWAAAATSRGGLELTSQHSTWHSFRSECEIISARSDIVSDLNPYGRIKYAELQIKGRKIGLSSDLYLNRYASTRIQRWTVNTTKHWTATCYLDWKARTDKLSLRGKLSMLLLSSWRVLPKHVSDSVHSEEISIYINDAKVDEKGECMNIEDYTSTATRNLEDGENRAVAGLLLHPATTDGKYVRVGVFSSDTSQGGLEAFQNCEYQEIHII